RAASAAVGRGHHLALGQQLEAIARDPVVAGGAQRGDHAPFRDPDLAGAGHLGGLLDAELHLVVAHAIAAVHAVAADARREGAAAVLALVEAQQVRFRANLVRHRLAEHLDELPLAAREPAREEAAEEAAATRAALVAGTPGLRAAGERGHAQHEQHATQACLADDTEGGL